MIPYTINLICGKILDIQTGNAVKGEKDRERRSEVCKYPGCGKQCRNYWELAIHTRSNHPSGRF